MQVLWMLMITLVLALSGVLGLAVLSHAARQDQAPLIPRPSRQPHCTVRSAVDARHGRFPCLLNYACAYYILHIG
jgi:hypothetical protein